MENKIGYVEAISHKNKSVKIDGIWSMMAPEVWEDVQKVQKGSKVEWDYVAATPNKNVLSWFKVIESNSYSAPTVVPVGKHSKDDQIVMQACLKVASEVVGWDIQQRKDLDSPVAERVKELAKEFYNYVKDGDY